MIPGYKVMSDPARAVPSTYTPKPALWIDDFLTVVLNGRSTVVLRPCKPRRRSLLNARKEVLSESTQVFTEGASEQCRRAAGPSMMRCEAALERWLATCCNCSSKGGRCSNSTLETSNGRNFEMFGAVRRNMRAVSRRSCASRPVCPLLKATNSDANLVIQFIQKCVDTAP